MSFFKPCDLTSLFRRSLAGAGLMLMLAAAVRASAATWTWTGGMGTITEMGTNTIAQWAPAGVPNVNGDTLQWNGVLSGNLTLSYTNGLNGSTGNAGLNLNLTTNQIGSLTIDTGTSTASLRLNNVTIAAGAGAFTLGNGANAFNITLGGGAGTRVWSNQSTNAATLNADVVFGSGSAANQTLIFDGSGDWVLNNKLYFSNGGVLTLVKSGGGTVVLAATNTYTGNTTVSNGTLVLQGGYASPAFNLLSNAVLELNVASGSRDSAAAVFSGTGTLRKTGGGQMVWGAAAASFALGSGALIDVQGGTFVAGSSANENWATNRSDLNVASGATFKTVEANVRLNRLTGGGTLGTGYSGAGYQSLTLGLDDGSSTFDGVIQNTDNNPSYVGNLVKVGSGTITLNGTNTYTGTTTVSAGTLVIGGSLQSRWVTVYSNAVLQMNAPGLGPTSWLSLSTGSTLNLAHGGTNLIGRLYLNGQPQAAGLWGAPGSGAPNTSPLITGTGKLAVTGGLLLVEPAELVNLTNGGWSVEWNSDGNFEGWSSSQVTGVSVSGGGLCGTASGAAPSVQVSNLNSADLDLGFNDYLELRLQLPAGFSGPVFIDYGTTNSVTSTGAPGFSASRRLVIPAGVVQSDGAFHTYQLDVSLEQLWRNTLNDLRIYPLGTNATVGQNFTIDYVRVGDVGPVPVQDGWMDSTGGMPYRVPSKHFVFSWNDQIITDVGMNTNWAHGNLRNAEECWAVYVKKLGYTPPQNNASNKVNFTCIYGGNFGGGPMFQISRYELRIDPPTWTTPHELMHVFQGAANGGNVPGDYAEMHANYGRERWLEHYQNLFPGETGFARSIRSEMHMNQPIGRNYYETWPFYLYCDLNPDNLPDLGEGTTVKLWRQMAAGEINYSTLERLTLNSSAKDIIGLYARRGLTLNYPGTVLRTAVGSSIDTWGQLTEPVRRPDDPTWFQVPTERAPQQGAFTIHELTPTGTGAGRVVSVNFRGLGYGSGLGADWRASFIVIADDGSERYSSLWNYGTNSVTLAANENRVYLCIAATPDNYRQAGFLEYDQQFRSDISKRRYPYEFQVFGATPKESNNGTTNGGWAVHSNGGGLKAATASVASTAYVGPTARVEDYAKVAGNAQIRDNAIVRGHADVRADTVISGNAIVGDFVVLTNSTVTGNARVCEHGNISSSTTVSGQAVVKGSAVCWGGTLTGNAIVDGDYGFNRGVTNAEVSGHWPWVGVPDSFLNPLPAFLFAAYDFSTNDAVLMLDTYSPGEALLRGAPGWVASDAGRSGVQTFNGSNQWVQLPRAVAELRAMTIATTVKWNGGADNQTLFQFGDGAAKFITFTPRNSSGLAELKVSNGTGTYSVTAPALTPGLWTQVGIALDGVAASINFNGAITGGGAVPVQPQQVLPPNTRDNPAHNYLGRGETSFFNGAVDSFRIYSSAVPSGLLVKVEALPASILETAVSTTLRFSRLALNGSATNGALTINYTVSGTATAGLDYAALSGSVTIPAGQSFVDVALSVLPDAVTESNETIVINLTAPAGYALVEGGTATLTLVDAPPLSASLLAWYKFDETSGTDAADSSGNNNTATLNNGPVWGTVDGQLALTFDGADDYVQTPVPSGGTRTLSAWIRPHTAMNSSLIYSVFDSDVPGAYGTGWGVANGQIRVILDDQFWNTGISVTLNQWQHGTLTFDATQARFYTNGVLAATLNYTQGSVGTTTYKIGRSNANPLTFDGDLRDARIYNRALYGGEVQQIFQTPLPWAPPLVSAMPNDQTVILSWQPAYLADSYAVERSLVSGGPFAPLGTTTGTSFTDSGLTNGVTYYYVVRGVNSSGNGPASVEVSATPQVIPTPGNGVWNNTAGGSWTNWANWMSNTVAGGTDRKSTFALGTPVTVSLDANRTLGSLSFSNANHTIAGTDILTLDVASGMPVVTVGSNVTATVQTPVAGVDGVLKSGQGTLVLAGANTLTGTVTITNGALALQNAYAATNFAIATNAVLELNLAGTRDYSAGTFSGAGTLRKTGEGKATWGSSVATFALGSGSAIDVQGGTLVGGSYGNENWTGNKADLNVAAGAVFEGVEANVRVDALTGAGAIQSGYSGAGYTAFTFGVDNGSGEFSGVLADNVAPGNFIKTGTGMQTLSGVNLYSGVTTLAGGVLNVAQFSNYGYPGGLGLRASDSSGNVGILFRGGTLQYTGAVPQSTDRAIRISTTGGATLDASGSQPSATLRFTAASSPDFFENSGARTLTLTGSNPGENTFAMTIAETGGATSLIKNGSGKWVLTGNNTYTGLTTVNAGVLWIHGTNAGSAITVTNATLGGTGTLKGPVTVQTGATLVPGASLGTLTISNTLTLAAGSQTFVELNAAAGTNDLVRGITTVNYGGTLVITNVAGTVSAGQTFKLFSAASRTGNFSAISPTNAGASLVWSFNPTNGVLTALATVALNPTNVTASVSGTNLTLTWPADHTGWTLQQQTNNLHSGVSANTNDWMRVPSSSATNSVVIPILPTQAGGYYRLVYP